MEGEPRAHVLVVVVGIVAAQIAVVDRAAGTEAEIDAVLVAEDVLEEGRGPDQADIAEIGAASGVDGEADIRAGRQQDLLPLRIAVGHEPLRRGEQNFAVDVEAMLDLGPADARICREEAELDLIDDPVAREGLGARGQAENEQTEYQFETKA